MLNFAFLLEGTESSGNLLEGLGGMLPMIIILLLMIPFFYFFSIRPRQKQEKEFAAMKNNLAVGDEITTIGGIIGKVVSIKEETFVLETTKDRTKIRFLKGAIRSVDVKMSDIVAANTAEKKAADESAPAPAEETKENK